MQPHYRIVGDSAVRLWGLTPARRLRRQLDKAGLRELEEDLEEAPDDAGVVVLDGTYFYDQRALTCLVRSPDTLLRATGGSSAPVVAAHVRPELVSGALAVVRGERAPEALGGVRPEALGGVRIERPDTLVPAFDERLRRKGTPTVLAVVPERSRALEDRLFGDAYKGVTDLVTKFVWPRPARAVTRLCVRLGLRPNHVTCFGLLLVVAAGFLFARGEYAAGLVAAWLMTFLDTVDGKLARVTVTSSRIGHALDHGTDIIHPPLWYLAWGMGLASFEPLVPGVSLTAAMVVMFAGYILGRLTEGAFQLWLGMFGIFLWRPFDSCFRLITARRNPSLIFLTASLVFARPDLGLEAVVWWTAASTVILFGRFLWAIGERLTKGPVRSWMLAADPETDRSLAVRWFVPRSPATEVVLEPVPRATVPALPHFAVGHFEAGGDGGGARVGVLTNPRSRRNRLSGLDGVRRLLAERPAVLHREAGSPVDAAAALAEFAAEGVELVVINGGDGTVDATLDGLLETWAPERLPILAVLPGGRTNMTAGDIGVRGGSRERALTRLFTWASDPDPARVVQRAVLRLEGASDGRTRHGLFFSTAGIFQASVNCWDFRAASRLPGMKTGLGTAVSVSTQVVEHLLGRGPLEAAPIRVWLDEEPFEERAFLALFVTTLERMALGIRPFWGSGPAPLRFTAVAYEHRHLLRAAPALLRGRPNGFLKPEHGYESRNVHRVTLEMEGGCTLDGQVVRPAAATPLRLSAGPSVRFVRP